MSTLVFTIPEVQPHLLSSHKDPLTVVSTAWTAEGHPNGTSTIVSYAVSLKGAQGITDSGMASFRFDVPVDEILKSAIDGKVVDLRGHVPHKP